MSYEFPLINNIKDVLPHIDDNFIVVDRGTHKIINYVLSGNETFPDIKTHGDAVRRECRGIIFDNETNEIIRRPLEKFFNCNERMETNVETINWNKSHIVLDKLDGSQIAPYQLSDGKLIWGTKMGATDVAAQVEDYVRDNPQYTLFARWCIGKSITPIFEWVSKKQRIVLEYPEDQLVLLALRHINTGKYYSYKEMNNILLGFNIPLVKSWNVDLSSGSHHSFIDELSRKEDIEGVVIRFDDGQQFKIKTQWYVRIHRNKELISSEKNLVDLIINNQLDDVLSFLPKEDRERVHKYEKVFHEAIDSWTNKINIIFAHIKNYGTDRKTFALGYGKELDPMVRMIIFKMYDNSELNTKEYLIELIKKHCTSNQQFAKLKNWLLKEVNYG